MHLNPTIDLESFTVEGPDHPRCLMYPSTGHASELLEIAEGEQKPGGALEGVGAVVLNCALAIDSIEGDWSKYARPIEEAPNFPRLKGLESLKARCGLIERIFHPDLVRILKTSNELNTLSKAELGNSNAVSESVKDTGAATSNTAE